MNAATDTWSAILGAALVGTQRQAWTPPAGTDNALSRTLAQLPAESAESRLLSAAALVHQVQRAGFAPPADAAPLPTAAPADTLPTVIAGAAGYVRDFIHRPYNMLLSEALIAVRAHGRTVPAESLPGILDRGYYDVTLRAAILTVLGPRGRWLASMRPEWAYALAAQSAADWSTATGAARTLLLRVLRERDPSAARDLLAASWRSEKAADRAALLDCLTVGLSLADEPFLEDCMADRSKYVRGTAIDLLVRMPQSTLASAIEGYLTRYIDWDGQTVAVDLTSVPDVSSFPRIADLLAAELLQEVNGMAGWPTFLPAPGALGARAQQLCHLLACVPPAVWSQRWGATAAQLTQAAASGPHNLLLLHGWQRAAARHPDLAWVAALLLYGDAGEVLLRNLTAEDREAVLLPLLSDAAEDGSGRLIGWLNVCNQAWSEPFARVAAEQIGRMLARPLARTARAYPVLLPPLARYFPPDLAALTAGWSAAKHSGAWQQAIEEFMILLDVRRAMLAALAADAAA